MKLSVQTDNLTLLPEAVRSDCYGIRFGSEFCEHLLPTIGALERAHGLVRDAGKPFTYVTPRLSNAGIERLAEQLPRLDALGAVAVVANDFGTLHLLRRYPHLRPKLGRHLFMVRARSPWLETHIRGEEPGSSRRQWIDELYSTTSLNYQPTLDLYHSLGCEQADMDWIPRIFPSLTFLVSSGWDISVHLSLVAATFTRRCHMARFLGETSPERCSMPCLGRAFRLGNEILEEFALELVLHGNTVFRIEPPSRDGIAELERVGAAEVILTMNPVTRVTSAREINEVMTSLL